MALYPVYHSVSFYTFQFFLHLLIIPIPLHPKALAVAGWFGAVPALASESYAVGDNIQVSTGLADGFETMGFTCIDEDYRGGYLFVADAVIPYSLASRYAAADNGYSTSDLRVWLNQYFADTLSVAEEICPVKLTETDDSISDRVFCLSIDEVRDPAYKEFVRDTGLGQ